MSEPFVAEIRVFPFNFTPTGWASCAGQLMPISQHTALFSLLGTRYGGNGNTHFALPDLRDRAPMHPGPSAAAATSDGTQQYLAVNYCIALEGIFPQRP
jgi:microcystin-dependent protein